MSFLHDLEPIWWPSDLPLSSPNAFCPDINHDHNEVAVKFDFLERFTTAEGLASSFRCGSLLQRQQVVSTQGTDGDFSKEAPNGFEDSTASVLSGSSCGSAGLLPDTFTWANSINLQSSLVEAESAISRLHSWAHHPLALKTQEIVDSLKNTIQHKQKRSFISLEWSDLIEEMCLIFFSPPNICKFLRLFWASWYPNCPIIHRPSFDPFNVSPSLLSSMVMIGSCLSPQKSDNNNATVWFNAVEVMVFNDEWLEEDYTTPAWTRNPGSDLRRLQSLQAAYFVCLFQNWEGSESSKQRIRRHRYNTLIAVSFGRPICCSCISLKTVSACLTKYRLLETSILRQSRIWIYRK